LKESAGENVTVKPKFMSICHADQRYYRGKRDRTVLDRKLPMALIHECCGEVIIDPTGEFKIGQNVVLIPNVLPKNPIDGILENYQPGSGFLSSGLDGFMREFVTIAPNRIVPFYKANPRNACVCELVSVVVHAVKRMKKIYENVNKIGIWGDGSVAFLLALVLKKMLSKSKVFVIGRHNEKLSCFSFVQNTFLESEIPTDFDFTCAFECVGGYSSTSAIESIIKYIIPQGTVFLLGVSEKKILMNTRMILEKGLTIVGSSRSSYDDFVDAISFLDDVEFESKVEEIITETGPVKSISGIHKVFETDFNTPFKTVFEWKL
jgi:ribitol-5-phosphate 2-dehydrogenase